MGSADLLSGALELERIQHFQRLALELALERLRDAAGLIELGCEPDVAADIGQAVAAVVAKVAAIQPVGLSADELFAYVALKLGAPQLLADSERKGGSTAGRANASARSALREAKRKAETKGVSPDGQFVTAMLAATQGVDSSTPIGVGTLGRLLAGMGLPDRLTNVRSLNTRLKRMRDRGFQQAGRARGPKRKQSQQAVPTGDRFERLPSGLAQIFGTQTGSRLLALLLK